MFGVLHMLSVHFEIFNKKLFLWLILIRTHFENYILHILTFAKIQFSHATCDFSFL